MSAFFAVITLPVMLLNTLAGIVGGIWLLVLGEWKLVVVGFVLMVTSTFSIGIAMLPSMIFAAPLQSAVERRNMGTFFFFGTLSLLWVYFLILVWGVGAFYLITKNYNFNPPLPYLLWAYAIATGPWVFMAQKEAQSGNTHSAFTATFACFGAIAMMIVTYWNNNTPTIQALAVGLGICLAISFIFQSVESILLARSQRGW